jgi:integrase
MAKKKTQARYATHLTTPTGDRVYVSARTEKELEEKLFEKKVELRAGVDITTDVLFRAYAELWIKTYKEGRIRPSSLSSLRSTFDKHIIPFFGDMCLKDIRPLHVQMFLREISGYSASLQRKCLTGLKSVLTSAVDNGLIVRSPVREEDKITAPGPQEEEPLTNEQAKALLAAVEGTRAYTFCLLALSTGMRRGEILGLMWEDIDWQERVIRVQHNKAFPNDADDAPVSTFPKTEAGRRDIPMGDMLYEYLSGLHAASQSDFVLCMRNGASLTKTSFRALWELVEARTAGKGRTKRELGDTYGGVTVSLDFDCHPHLLRHTYITQLFEAGLDVKQVQYLAGHSTPEMTMRVYTHYRAKQRAEETHRQVCTALNYLS